MCLNPSAPEMQRGAERLGQHLAVFAVCAEGFHELSVLNSQLGMAAYEGVPLRPLTPVHRPVDAMLHLHGILPVMPPATRHISCHISVTSLLFSQLFFSSVRDGMLPVHAATST